MTETAQSTVYFIRRSTDASGPVKIGFTKHLPNRLRALYTATPGGVDLVAEIQGGTRALETHLHERFSHLRLSGEWFHSDDELDRLIAQIKRAGTAAKNLFANAIEDAPSGSDQSAEVSLAAKRAEYMLSHLTSQGASLMASYEEVGSRCSVGGNAIKHLVSGRAKQITVEKFTAINAAYLDLLKSQRDQIIDLINEAEDQQSAEVIEVDLLDQISALRDRLRAATQQRKGKGE